ncbi:MAG: hypothetical protein EX267_12735, partial [Acidimicrobiia bacterium]
MSERLYYRNDDEFNTAFDAAVASIRTRGRHRGGEAWKGNLMQSRALGVGAGMLVVVFSVTACDAFGDGVRGSGTVVTES